MKPAPHVTTGSRELKTRLGTYLDMVRQGTIVTVTDRGKPVAQLTPIPLRDANDVAGALDRLAERGLVTRPSRRAPAATDRAPLVPMSGSALSDLVLGEREDRF